MFDFTTSNLLLLISVFWAFFLLTNSSKMPSDQRGGWRIAAALTLAIAAAGWRFTPGVAGYFSAGFFLVAVALPGLAGRVMARRTNAGDYDAALRWARLMVLLHPADGYSAQLRMIEAMREAKRGDFTPLDRLLIEIDTRPGAPPSGEALSVLRMLARWEEIVRRAEAMKRGEHLELTPQLALALMRALAETGELGQALNVYRALRQERPGSYFQSLRYQGLDLLFAAFGGRTDLTQKLLNLLPHLAPSSREAWLLTARLAAGQPGREALRGLRDRESNAILRRILDHRLEMGERLVNPALGAEDAALLDEMERDLAHAIRYGGPTAGQAKPVVTIALLIAIGIMFAVELQRGALDSDRMLWRLGAFDATAVMRGQWWRLVAHMFLHGNWPHVAFNSMALWYFGPFVERAFGKLRYLICYMASGIGAAILLTVLINYRLVPNETMVGASGAIMGLIGAMGAILLRGWRSDSSALAKARLRSIVSIIVMQAIFDHIVPQISWQTHLLGLTLGFVVGWVIQPRRVAENT